MSKLRAAGVAVVVLAPIVALPAQAAGPRPVTLVETVSVETSHSATIEVSLPDDARVSVSPTAHDVTFDGAGRMLGVWLRRSDQSGDFLSSYRLPAFAGGEQVTYGSVPAPDCTAQPDDALPVAYDCTRATFSQTAVLHEGRYRLTVLADGSPVRVTLRLHGLDAGELALTPQRTIASSEQSLPVRESAGDNLITFGRAASIGAPVQAFVVATAKGAGDSAFEESSVCVQPSDAQAPFAYGPHCAGGTAGQYQYTAGPGLRGGGVFVSSSSEDDTGPVGLGGSFGDSDGVAFGQALGVWLART
jgi:hypothetical protein